MFQNIEKKIKGCAGVCAVLGILMAFFGFMSFVAGLAERSGGSYIGLGIILLFTGFFSIIGSWFLYGFGQLIENTYPNDRMSEKAPESSAQDLTSHFCPCCGEKGSASDVFCSSCGKNISQQDTSLTR